MDPDLNNAIEATIADLCIACTNLSDEMQAQGAIWRVIRDLSILLDRTASSDLITEIWDRYEDVKVEGKIIGYQAYLTAPSCHLNRARVSCRIAQRLARGNPPTDEILNGMCNTITNMLTFGRLTR